MTRKAWTAVVLAATLTLSGCLGDDSDEGGAGGSDQAPAPDRIAIADLAGVRSVPACEHPASQLENGQISFGNNGSVGLVQGADGDFWNLATTLSGNPDRLVRITCSQGGVNWPEVMAVYSTGPDALAGLDLGSVDYPGNGSEHADVIGASRSGDAVVLSWKTYSGSGWDYTQTSYWDGTLHMRDGQLVLEGIEERR